MILHEVKVHPSETALAREDHLAWKLAGIATEKGATPKDVTAMIINRIIDNAGAAVAAINRRPAVSARSAALGHMKKAGGAQLFGCRQSVTVSPEWAAWANGTAVRELGLHDLLAATDDVHPGDAIPPLLAAAQAMERSGRDLVRGIATAYEVQVNLAKAIPLRQHSISHIAHLCPAQAAGIGALLGLKQDIIYQAVQQAVQVSFTAGRSESSSWQSFASAHAGKLAVEAVDRAMRGETAPGLAYEGEDAVIAALLGGIDAIYNVSLPEPGEGKRAILDTFTKEHAASYPAQALIDLAIKMREEIEDSEAIEKVVIFTSRHTHETIGTGAGDAQAPEHSAMHVFAVALQDGFWHHASSGAPRRAGRADTQELRQKIETVEDPEWTRRYHAAETAEQAFGARAEIVFTDGSKLVDELAFANAHPQGASPFGREDYIRKFVTLTEGIITRRESNRFLDVVQDLPRLSAGELGALNVALPAGALDESKPGIF